MYHLKVLSDEAVLYLPGIKPHAIERKGLMHDLRLGRISYLIARELDLPEEQCKDISYAATKHDEGKIYIDKTILDKPSSLTREERLIMQKHTFLGAAHIHLTENNGIMLSIPAKVALYHHERIDGTGYPFGLSGEQISIEPRIVAVADVYDGWTSDRPYRNAMTHTFGMHILEEEAANNHFDPIVVGMAVKLEGKIRQISRMFN